MPRSLFQPTLVSVVYFGIGLFPLLSLGLFVPRSKGWVNGEVGGTKACSGHVGSNDHTLGPARWSGLYIFVALQIVTKKGKYL